jgi:diguanylate cyclase (GGDEF)-like protein
MNAGINIGLERGHLSIIGIDALTGPMNRTSAKNAIESLLEDDDVTIALLDFPDFILVNQEFGHVLGDQILVRIAVVLALHSQSGDVVARLGGDSFLVARAGHQTYQLSYLSSQVQAAMAFPVPDSRGPLRKTLTSVVRTISKNGDYKTTLTKAEDEICLLDANLRRTEGHGYG